MPEFKATPAQQAAVERTELWKADSVSLAGTR